MEDSRDVPPTPRRLLVILHGLRAGQKDVRDAIAAARKTGIEVEVRVTWEEGDTGRFIKSEVFGDADHAPLHAPDGPGLTIVAAGGDGTINECAAALMEAGLPSHVSLAVLPLGTSNDFAATCNIPQDMEMALRLAADSDCVHPIDIGLLNGKVFMNTASLGAGSEIGAETSAAAKAALGPAAFLVGGLQKLVSCHPVRCKLTYPKVTPRVPPTPTSPGHTSVPPEAPSTTPTTDRKTLDAEMAAAAATSTDPAVRRLAGHDAGSGGRDASAAAGGGTGGGAGQEAQGDAAGAQPAAVGDGNEVVEVEVLHLTACNNRQIASMVQPCPGALLDDGCLDLLYVVGRPTDHVWSVLSDLLTRGNGGSAAGTDGGNICALRVPWLQLTGDEAMPAMCDGENIAVADTFKLEVIPRRLPFHLPDDRLLLSGVGGPHDTAPATASAATQAQQAAAGATRGGNGAPASAAHHVAPLLRHRHSIKDMLFAVTRFRRPRPGQLPGVVSALIKVVRQAAPVLVAYALGRAVTRHSLGLPEEEMCVC